MLLVLLNYGKGLYRTSSARGGEACSVMTGPAWRLVSGFLDCKKGIGALNCKVGVLRVLGSLRTFYHSDCHPVVPRLLQGAAGYYVKNAGTTKERSLYIVSK